MPKRITRISVNSASGLTGLLGREVHLVCSNGSTFFGELQKVADTVLILHDKRRHSHTFERSVIQEVVYEESTPW